MVLKCKLCGGTLNILENETVCECNYCGSLQTLPNQNDEKILKLYDRAHHFRQNNEFDKAAGCFEQIIDEDDKDAEAYWSLLLCEYGIEYVEDPTSGERVPTVHRAQYTSIFDDINYKTALEYADSKQKEIYEKEAKVLNDIQKKYLTISQTQDDYDVFICYKETDDNGRRTEDSVLAFDIYNQLTREGFKVFYSKITLEDKLGEDYEPYIFAALNSAKVMIALGTKPEYFNAVWVKNEWSRYLSLAKKSDGKKVIIPAFKNMDPYDLPEEFLHLQAQDMSKLGFIQDLVYGIKKIVNGKENDSKKTSKDTEEISSLVKRGYLFLEDGDFGQAEIYSERILDKDPECADAYLMKLMIDCRAKKKDDLLRKVVGTLSSINANAYKRIVQFGNQEIKDFIAEVERRGKYNLATEFFADAQKELELNNFEAVYKKLENAQKQLEELGDYQSCSEYLALCQELEMRIKYVRALTSFEDSENDLHLKEFESANIKAKNAIEQFEALDDYQNSLDYLSKCHELEVTIKDEEKAYILAEDIKRNEAQEEFERKKHKEKRTRIIKKIFIVIMILFAILFFLELFLNSTRIIAYMNAVSYKNKGEYEEAIDYFDRVDTFLNADKQVLDCYYLQGQNYMEQLEYTKAIDSFKKCSSYKDSSLQLDKAEMKQKEEDAKALKKADSEKEILQIVGVGEEVQFGEHNWLVIDRDDSRVFLLSTPLEETLMFDSRGDEKKDILWSNSDIREHLNNSFLETDFNKYEQAMICEVAVTSKDEEVDSNGVSSSTEETMDKVFLLSLDELDKAYQNDKVRNKAWDWLHLGNVLLRDTVRDTEYDPEATRRVVTGSLDILTHLCSGSDSMTSGIYAVLPAIWVSVE